MDSITNTHILTETDLKNLFDNFFKALSVFAFEYVQDRETAVEIVQNAYVELWDSRERLAHTDNLKAYLYTMVRNDCISFLRKKKHQPEITPLTSNDFLETNIIKWETIRILYDAIEQLSEQSRVIINHSLDGLKNQEIAELLNISPNTVHTVKKRAYKKLKELLKDHYYLLLIILNNLD